MVIQTMKDFSKRKKKPVLLHFQKPTDSTKEPDMINVDLNDLLKNFGSEQITYDSFDSIFSKNEPIKNIISDYNKTGIIINKPKKQIDKTSTKKDSDSEKTVSSMASRAAKKELKSKI